MSATKLGPYGRSYSKGSSQDGLSADEAMAASDADPARPPTTGNPADNPDHPIMANLRGGQPRAAAAVDFFAGE